jgi:hypothetical protein
MDTELSEAPIVSFRPVKRQKHMRKRADESDDVPLSANTVDEQRAKSEERHSIARESRENDGQDGGVSNILRQRKLNRMRKGGIEFSTSNSQLANTNKNLELAVGATETDVMKAKFERFTAHTGQTVDVNRHMYVLMLL